MRPIHSSFCSSVPPTMIGSVPRKVASTPVAMPKSMMLHAAIENAGATTECLCVFLTPDQKRLIVLRANANNQLSTHYSDDDGATWQRLARPQDVSFTLTGSLQPRMAGCFIGNDMVALYRWSGDINQQSYTFLDDPESRAI